MNEQLPTQRQRAYLRYLLSQAHDAGVPYLPIEHLHRDGVAAWIEYLDVLVQAHWNIQRDLARMKAEKQSSPYLMTPPRDQLPASYRPPYDLLPAADDHEHLVGSVKREDGVEESVCVLCGVSA
jgi:hypothetical protein